MPKKSGRVQHILRMPNNLINGIFSLSVDAKKLFLAILAHMREDRKEIEIYRQDVYKKVGIELKNLNPLHREAIIEELMKTIVTIRDIEKPENWVKIQLLGKTSYEDGILRTRIDEELLPHLLRAQKEFFTRFRLEHIKPMHSSYAIRIYLMLKQFEDTGWREDTIENFKKMFELEGKYKRLYDLKRRVIDVAVKEINEKTDMQVAYEIIKKGRKAHKIRFKISRNKARVERKENKKLIAQNKYEELEQKLNGQYKGKSFRGENGLNWIVNQIQVLNENEVEITATDLQHTASFVKKIYEIEELFNA